jgi:hypothetical protein
VAIARFLQVTQAYTQEVSGSLGLFGTTSVGRNNGKELWVTVAHFGPEAV